MVIGEIGSLRTIASEEFQRTDHRLIKAQQDRVILGIKIGLFCILLVSIFPSKMTVSTPPMNLVDLIIAELPGANFANPDSSGFVCEQLFKGVDDCLMASFGARLVQHGEKGLVGLESGHKGGCFFAGAIWEASKCILRSHAAHRRTAGRVHPPVRKDLGGSWPRV